MSPTARVNALLLALPAALLAGALGFQHFGGLTPCEMCIWQRWPHAIAVAAALLAIAASRARVPLLWLASICVAVSGGIGVYHAGVEQGWWEGLTTCASTGVEAGDFTRAMLDAPVVRCDAIPWSLAGLSMAGWNAVLSIGGALLAAWWLGAGRATQPA